MMLLAATIDLIAIFIALELTSISLYILVAFLKTVPSSEAGIKYLLLGALSTAITLYGMAFLFGLSGSTSLSDIANTVAAANDDTRAALILAVVLLTAGLGFKMAVVPFQMWVPDVYEGAPTPDHRLPLGGKQGGGIRHRVAYILRRVGHRFISDDWAIMFAVLAAVSMSVGNVVALVQPNIKRMLGYSSIAQAGYLLVGLAAITAHNGDLPLGASGVVFFLGAYAFSNLGAFIAIIAISNQTGSDEISSYAGMYRRSPLMALGLTLCLISLTGIPPTAGFIAKFYIFDTAVQSDLVWLVIIAVLNSVVSAYYYVRVVLQHCTYDPATRGGDAPDGRKVKATLHWVSADHAIDAEVRLYDHLFSVPVPADVKNGQDFKDHINPNSLETLTGCKLEPSLAGATPGSRYQFERLGYFCVDTFDSTPSDRCSTAR